MLKVTVIGFAIGILVARKFGRSSRRIGDRRGLCAFETGRITTDESYGCLDSIDVRIADRSIDTACEMEDIACFRHTTGKHFLEIGWAKRTLPRLPIAFSGGEVRTYEPRCGRHLSCEKQDKRQNR